MKINDSGIVFIFRPGSWGLKGCLPICCMQNYTVKYMTFWDLGPSYYYNKNCTYESPKTRSLMEWCKDRHIAKYFYVPCNMSSWGQKEAWWLAKQYFKEYFIYATIISSQFDDFSFFVIFFSLYMNCSRSLKLASL